MFDDFRQQADETEYEEQPVEGVAAGVANPASTIASTPLPQRPRRILGMTGPQRFVIAVLLMFQVCLLGILFLLVTQRIVPAFLY